MCYVSFSGFRILPILFFHYGALFCEEFQQPEKTVEFRDATTFFPHDIMSEKRPQIFHTDDALLPRCEYVGCFLRLEFERLLPIFVDALKCIVLTLIFLCEEPSKVSHIQRRRSRDKSTLNNALILTANFVIQPDLSTKTPHKSKFTICFSAPL